VSLETVNQADKAGLKAPHTGVLYIGLLKDQVELFAHAYSINVDLYRTLLGFR